MTAFNRFGNMFPSDRMMESSYLLAEDPFQIYGNLYHVGNTWCSSHLIDTGEGLILLDTPCANELAYLIDNIYRLGFELRDLKIILVSHAHADHYGSVNALKYLTGAKTMMGRVDSLDMQARREEMEARTMGPNRAKDECFVPDVMLDDGDVVELGNTSIRCVLTPGHTIGVMSHFWTAHGPEGDKKVGIYGGAGFVTLQPQNIERMGLPADIREQFAASIDKVWDEPVDIMLGNHPFHSDIYDKHERQLREGGNPFIDPAEWHRFLTELKERYAQFLKMTPGEIKAMYAESDFFKYRPSAAKR